MGIMYNRLNNITRYSEQLVNRLISSESEIEAGKLRKGDLKEHEWIQLHSKIKDLSKIKFSIVLKKSYIVMGPFCEEIEPFYN